MLKPKQRKKKNQKPELKDLRKRDRESNTNVVIKVGKSLSMTYDRMPVAMDMKSVKHHHDDVLRILQKMKQSSRACDRTDAGGLV